MLVGETLDLENMIIDNIRLSLPIKFLCKEDCKGVCTKCYETFKTPVTLTIANRENRQLLISGTVDIEVAIPCGRCLEEVPTQVCFDINKELSMNEGVLVDEEMEETDYLIGFELDVDKLVYAEILVNWPMKVLCKEDCEGICKVCGANLNKGDCGCQRTELDPRMAAIQDIFSKFKEV